MRTRRARLRRDETRSPPLAALTTDNDSIETLRPENHDVDAHSERDVSTDRLGGGGPTSVACAHRPADPSLVRWRRATVRARGRPQGRLLRGACVIRAEIDAFGGRSLRSRLRC